MRIAKAEILSHSIQGAHLADPEIRSCYMLGGLLVAAFSFPFRNFDLLERRANKRWKEMLAQYEPPKSTPLLTRRYWISPPGKNTDHDQRH